MDTKIQRASTMDAPSGQLYQVHIHAPDKLYSARWHDPASNNSRDNKQVYVAVDSNDGLISLPYSDNDKIREIMRKAQELLTYIAERSVLRDTHGQQLRYALEEMLKEYRLGFPEHRTELYEMLVEDGLAEWRATGPEDREPFAKGELAPND